MCLSKHFASSSSYSLLDDIKKWWKSWKVNFNKYWNEISDYEKKCWLCF